jgi:two-component system, NarL family, sensor histidine kinase UhpB
MLLDLGLSHAIEQVVVFWQKRHPEVVFDLLVDQTSFGAKIDEVAYRIVQEAVSNAMRHGKPSQVTIQVEVTDGNTLRIRVANNGKGLEANGVYGFGLAGMRERISSLGGELTIADAANGRGVELSATLPLTETNSVPDIKREREVYAL